MNNIQLLVKTINHKIEKWNADGSFSYRLPSTMTYGIALKASLLFELLIQECNRVLLPSFPHRQQFAPKWCSARTLDNDRAVRKRCLAENLALLSAFEEDIQRAEYKPHAASISLLGDKLRRVRNQFVHPSSCFCAEGFDLRDLQFCTRLKTFLDNLAAFCNSEFISSISEFQTTDCLDLELEMETDF